MSAVLALYRGLTAVAEPFAPYVLKARLKRGKEDPARLNERLGRPKLARPEGEVIWLHGASVGETLSLLPVVDALQKARPRATILMTSGTRTSAEVMGKRLPKGAIHQYIPVDTPGAARGFIEHWRPALGIFVESDLWPNLLRAAHRRGVKLALISARVGDKTVRNWRRAPGVPREIFSYLDLVLPQYEGQAVYMNQFGARDDGRLNLKFAGDPLPVDEVKLDIERRATDARPVLLAASTHPGEDEVMLDAFEPLANDAKRPLLIIVPRHPDRGAAIASVAQARGFRAGLRSRGEAIDDATQVYVADTLGELGLWFRLARAAFIGGSMFRGVGGHNPLESIRLGCAVASGPERINWFPIYNILDAGRDVRTVRSASQLSDYFAAAMVEKPLAASDPVLEMIRRSSDLGPVMKQLQALIA
ncbi:MAG TPA: glycosyltransferase N-terminal domain-containing protein [Caulobacteraceae bacterium]|nr:glycosyltransferase N-terminal domain-containing protein [Caulobacteraceae bacterium]